MATPFPRNPSLWHGRLLSVWGGPAFARGSAARFLELLRSPLTPLLDELFHDYDAVERHHTLVRATPERTWRALRTADVGRSFLVHALLAVRALPALLSRRRDIAGPRPGVLTLDDLLRSGFVLLGERPGEEVVFGIVGKFWRPTGVVRHVEPADFVVFDEPGWAKAAWSFTVKPDPGGRTRLATETRVLCTDPASRRRFRGYWLFIRPFSGLIRSSVLRTIRDAAERSATT